MKLKNSFPDIFKDRLGQCTMTKATLTLKQSDPSLPMRQVCALRLYQLWSKSLTVFSTWASLNM